MADSHLEPVVRHIQSLAAGPAAGPADGPLLHAFRTRRDEAAFAALVRRHGPLVLRVCRRVLRQEQDAEDAFQATFLVLARDAAAIRDAGALASWLHGVAFRMAKKAQRDAACRRRHEHQAAAAPRSAPAGDMAWREVQAALDEEVQRLPAACRAVFVLCGLEGESRAGAAHRLGLKEGTVSSRLAHARRLLRQRLARRGIVLAAVLAAAAVAADGAAAVPAGLRRATIQAGLRYAADPLAIDGLAPAVAALLKGATHAMLTSKLKLATALLIAAGAVAAGSGALLGRPAADPPKPDPVPAARPGAGLPADWSRTVGPDPLTDGAGQVLSAGSKVTLRVEQGWLVVRRETAGGELEWQVVLARADDPRPPQVRLDKGAFTLDIRYGSFFIRESGGLLRVLRERKADQSPPWSRLPLDANRRSMGWAGSGDPTRVAGWEVGDWCWATVGPADDRADVLVRLHHKELLGKGHGFTSIANALAKMDAGPKYVQDEGDLLIADRTRPEVAVWMLQAKKVRQEIGTKPAPALAARRWFNAPDGLELDKLRGKVVLLDFWGTWCGPCVQKLPRTEELHQKYKDRGLVVIGVHSAQDGDKVADFLKAKGFTFPVAIDQGGTAKQYAIEAWPTYFLIDKSGKVAWGFEHEPPPEGRIEELLR